MGLFFGYCCGKIWKLFSLSLSSEAKQREQEQKEKLRFQEVDEEEYDALPEEEKEHFDRQRLQLVRERKCRYVGFWDVCSLAPRH